MALEFRGVHAAFLADTTSEIDLEGSRYSGKTYVCAAKVIQSCLDYPGIEWLICRYSGEETKHTLRPEFLRICRYFDVFPEWDDKEAAYHFPEKRGVTSKVFAYGLKSQAREQELAKVRGLDVAGVWVDQAEELPQMISEELRFATRKPNYPHQLIFSPNPPTEDHYLTDQFPEDNPLAHRRYYRVSLYDNAHNLKEGKIAELEAMYPPTHAKHKSLILGQRGVNVVGTPVYDGVFQRTRHLQSVAYDPTRPVLEALQYGQHHPTWLVAQRNYWGGMTVLGGIMGKRMFLEDFLPLVATYRHQWFPDAIFKTCCDPPPQVGTNFRYTNIATLKSAGYAPVWRIGSTSPDVREAVIQNIAACMRRPSTGRDGFAITDDPTRVLMASQQIVKQHRFIIDGLESGYVWSEHDVSVGSKLVRQPKADEWVGGAQRCLENIWLNFCADHASDHDADRDAQRPADYRPYRPASVWG